MCDTSESGRDGTLGAVSLRRAYRIVSLGALALAVTACGDEPSAQPGSTTAVAEAAPAAPAADGCSSDNSPTVAAAAPAPAPRIAVRPESAANELPDLAVRRINCAGGWVNLKNEIPADRPVLVWFWAPY